MTTFGNRESRTGTVEFAHGTFRFTVDYWTNGDSSAAVEPDLDHVMGVLIGSTYADMSTFNEAVGATTSDGVTQYATARTITLGASIRVKVAVKLNRPFPSMLLAGFVEALLAKVTVCMLHTVDPNTKQDLVDWLNVIARSMMATVFASMFGSFRSSGSEKRYGAGSYAGANATS